jgi:2-polyprenyl-3-methyl-5-hydroxy-6-metoxy-1,4-benzoquinol methylase
VDQQIDRNSKSIKEWTHAASNFVDKMECNEPYNKILLPAVASILNSLNYTTVLDVGCGYGKLAKFIASNAKMVTAFDPVEEFIFHAEREPSGVNFLVSEIGRYDGQKVDLVTCINVLNSIECLPDAVKFLSSRLVDGGTIIISVEHPLRTAKKSCSPDIKFDSNINENYFRQWKYTSNFLGIDAPISGWHRSLEMYFNSFSQNGLSISSIVEPTIISSDEEDTDFSDISSHPFFLVFVLRKMTTLEL